MNASAPYSIHPVRAKYVSGDPQPGIVELDFVDANGVQWTVLDKATTFSKATWTPESGTPDDVGIDCTILRELDCDRVEVQLEWGCTSTEGEAVFTMNSADLH